MCVVTDRLQTIYSLVFCKLLRSGSILPAQTYRPCSYFTLYVFIQSKNTAISYLPVCVQLWLLLDLGFGLADNVTKTKKLGNKVSLGQWFPTFLVACTPKLL